MHFETDRQTLCDLSVIADDHDRSLLLLFQPLTIGGMVRLRTIADYPLNSVDDIIERLEAIKFFGEHTIQLPIGKQEIDFVEYYLKQPNRVNTQSNFNAYKAFLKDWFRASNEYYIVKRGVTLLYRMLYKLNEILEPLVVPDSLKHIQTELTYFLANLPNQLRTNYNGGAINSVGIEQLDYLFRYSKSTEIRRIIDDLYLLDVYTAVAKTANALHFCYPAISEHRAPQLHLSSFFHPFITNAVKNDISFSQEKNMCFISGANMAGKSTALKAIGICTYLSHLGFPVPAQAMQTSVFNGLFTTINLSDNILAGHSHFYSEVLRIKQIATKVKEEKSIVVIFDELFRGTNVKDAFEASVAIIQAFSEIKNSIFIISTHVIETADELKHLNNLFFNCFATTMVNGKPIYNYTLQPGLSKERLGMKIIQDSGLLEIISKASKNK